MAVDRDDNFRVELLECAKLLNLQSDDYTKELFNQTTLEHYYLVQEDDDDDHHFIIKEIEKKVERINNDHYKILNEKFIDVDINDESLIKILSEIKDSDSILCDNLENVITRDSIELEEPLFPKKIQLKDNDFITDYQVPTIKTLTPNYVPEPISEEEEMQTYTIEDLCPLYHEAMADEIENLTSFEQEIQHKDETILVEDLKFENKYFEEPILPIKSLKINNNNNNDFIPNIPNSISEIISSSSIINEEEINLIFKKNNEKNSFVIEEPFNAKVPLEMMNEWERVIDIANDLEETLSDISNDINDGEKLFEVTSSRKMYELEPVLIPLKNDPLEMGRRKRRKKESETEEDVIIAESLADVINHIVPENDLIPTLSKQSDEDEELQKDLDNMITIGTPFDQWNFIMTQSMDEICGLKFKVPQLPHPLTYINKSSFIVPTRLSDLVISNSSKSDSEFQILSPFNGMKTLELLLHWNPIKKFEKLELYEIVDVSDKPYDNNIDIVIQQQKEVENFFDSDDLLNLIDFKINITKVTDEICLKTKKDMKRKQLEKETTAAIVTSSRNKFGIRNKPFSSSTTNTTTTHKKFSQIKTQNKISNISNRKKKSSSKTNKLHESVDIQQLLQRPNIGKNRNVDKSMPDAMKWIQEEEEVSLPELVDDSLSGQDRVTQWLSSCGFNKSLNNKNNSKVYNDIEVIDLTQDKDKEVRQQDNKVGYNEVRKDKELIMYEEINQDKELVYEGINQDKELIYEEINQDKELIYEEISQDKELTIYEEISQGKELTIYEEINQGKELIYEEINQGKELIYEEINQGKEVMDLTKDTEDTVDIEDTEDTVVKDLTQDKEVIDLTQDTDVSTPENPTDVDDTFIEMTSPFFKNNFKSSVPSIEQNLYNSTYFSNSFSATKSIDDFLALRGKFSPRKKRREAELQNEKNKESTVSPSSSHVNSVTSKNVPMLNKNSFIAIGKAILEQLPIPDVIHKYIVSARIFPNRRLLTALKSKDCKVELVERDFEYMRSFLSEEEKSDAIHVDVDFIIDERTGVIFYPLNMLSQNQAVLKLVRTILRLHLKYSNLYLILETYVWSNRSESSNMEYTIATYPFTLPVLKSVSELNLMLMCCNCDAKVIFSLCEEMSAKLLRMIGDSCATKCDIEGSTRIGNRGWKDRKQWETRDWITPEESLHERFLSCFTPLINPFTAQIILTATTLLQFFQMTHSERCDLVGGWVDETRLEKFDEIIHEILLSDSTNDTEQLFTTGGLPVIIID